MRRAISGCTSKVSRSSGALRDDVQMTAHRPEEILRLLELAQLRAGEQARIHQLGDVAHLVHIFADPEQRVQVAQAPLPSLRFGSTT